MNPIVAFDVDGTLIDQHDLPRYSVIDLFRKLESLGCTMVVWSGGGIDYARHWTRRLGLKAQVHPKGAFIADIAVDDLPDGDGSKLGKVIIKV